MVALVLSAMFLCVGGGVRKINLGEHFGESKKEQLTVLPAICCVCVCSLLVKVDIPIDAPECYRVVVPGIGGRFKESWGDLFLDVSASGVVNLATKVLIGETTIFFGDSGISQGEQIGELLVGEPIDFCLVVLDTGVKEWFGSVEANHWELVFGRVDVFFGEKCGGPNKLRDVVKEFLPKFRCDWLVVVDCVHI